MTELQEVAAALPVRPDPEPPRDPASAVPLPVEISTAVVELAGAHGCRPADVVVAAWFALARRYGAQDAVLMEVEPRTSFLGLLDIVCRRRDQIVSDEVPVVDDRLPLVLRLPAATRLPNLPTTAGHLATLLASGCARPSVPLGRLRMLTATEIEQLSVFGGTGESVVPIRTVPATVAAHARATPERPALVHGGRCMSYGELELRANRLAHYLASHGVRRQSVVGLLLDRSPDWLVTVLAAFKLGALPLPLDPTAPTPRLTEALAVTPPTVTVGVARTTLTVPDGVGRLLLLDRDQELIDRHDDTDPGVDVGPADQAYVLQTSGSTGVPKAIGGLHGALAHAGRQAVRIDRTGPADRVAWLIPPSAAIVFYLVAAALTAGAALHIAEPDVVADPPALRDWLVAEGITQVLAVTPIGEALQALPWPRDTSLRTMTVAGEQLRRWGSADLPFEVGALYGCAEAFMITDSFHPWPRRMTSATATAADRSAAPPVGRPIPGVRVRLVDADLNPVPVGVVGEVLVSTPQLSIGYLSDPAATAAKFRPDPFGAPGSRLFRTGDLARFRPDGVLEHRGRIDSMVKIRGYRIEVAEVERALLAHPSVAEAAVVPAVGRAGRTELVACVVTDADTSGAQLREHVAALLPEYMVPSAYPVLDRLPRNASDKIDRAALPPADWPDVRGGRAYRAPRDEIEERVVALWQELLGLDRVGVDDHFLELGGDSLLASRFRARTRERWGVEIDPQEMLVRATPGEIAQLLRARAGRPATRAFPPVIPGQGVRT
jgi:amino acid adenylation domain-containing protein